MKIGTAIHSVLSHVGITPNAVSKVIGRPCRCKQRADALDAAMERMLLNAVARKSDITALFNRLCKFVMNAPRHYSKETRRFWHKLVGTNGGCVSCKGNSVGATEITSA